MNLKLGLFIPGLPAGGKLAREGWGWGVFGYTIKYHGWERALFFFMKNMHIERAKGNGTKTSWP